MGHIQPIPEIDGLQVHQDLAFQKKFWKCQRISGHIFGAVILLAISGIFGGGPLSEGLKASGNLRVEYRRFERLAAPNSLSVYLSNPDRRETSVSIDRHLLSDVRIHSITPEPDRVISKDGEIIFVFHNAGNALEATFFYEPVKAGVKKGILKTPYDELEIRQFVYP